MTARSMISSGLIEVPNASLYAWVVGSEAVPPDYDTAVLRDLIAFHESAEARR